MEDARSGDYDHLLQVVMRTVDTFSEDRDEEEESAARRNADHIDGYDRDDLGESPDY